MVQPELLHAVVVAGGMSALGGSLVGAPGRRRMVAEDESHAS